VLAMSLHEKLNKMRTLDLLIGLGFKNTANFTNNVAKRLPNGVEKAYLSSVGMEWKGRGSYSYFLDIEINGEMTTLRKHTNDSTAWDSYKSMEDGSRALDNLKKQVVLMILEDCKELIIEELEELA
jgi:hypothetical protein